MARAAALATLQIVEEERIVENASNRNIRFGKRLSSADNVRLHAWPVLISESFTNASESTLDIVRDKQGAVLAT